MIGFLAIGRHDRLRKLLSSYIDGQVTPSESARVEEHLSTCEECQRDLENLRTTVGLLRALPELEVPRSFALDAPPEAVSAPRPLGWAAGLAASAAVLAALVAGDLTGLLEQTDRATQEEAVAVIEAPAAAAEMAAPAAAPEAAMAAPAPAPEAMAAPAPTPTAVEVTVTKEVEREVVVEAEKQATPAALAPRQAPAPAAAMAARESVSKIEAQSQAAPAPPPTPPPVTPAVAARAEAVSAPKAAQQDDTAVVEKQTPVSVVSAAVLEEATPSTPSAPEAVGPGDGAISLPLRELELAAGALLIAMMATTLSLFLRRRRSI